MSTVDYFNSLTDPVYDEDTSSIALLTFNYHNFEPPYYKAHSQRKSSGYHVRRLNVSWVTPDPMSINALTLKAPNIFQLLFI